MVLLGKKIIDLGGKLQASESIAPVLLLDGNYAAVITPCHSVVKIVNTRNGVEKSHFLLHGLAVDMKVDLDDRTIYISTADGLVLVMLIILESCDPIIMLINNIPSRMIK